MSTTLILDASAASAQLHRKTKLFNLLQPVAKIKIFSPSFERDLFTGQYESSTISGPNMKGESVDYCACGAAGFSSRRLIASTRESSAI